MLQVSGVLALAASRKCEPVQLYDRQVVTFQSRKAALGFLGPVSAISGSKLRSNRLPTGCGTEVQAAKPAPPFANLITGIPLRA